MPHREPTVSGSTQDLPRSTSDSTFIESASPRTEHILRTLDFEINRIVAEQRQPGWTVWALLGSLATTIWLLSGEFKVGSFTLGKVLWLFLVISILIDVLLNVNDLLAERTPGLKRGGRFRLSIYYIGEYRVDTFVWAVRSVVLIMIARGAANEVWWPQAYIVYSYYGVSAVIAATGLILSFLRVPLPAPLLSETPSVRIRLLAVCLLAAVAWSLTGYFFAMVPHPEAVNPSDLRVSFLLVVATYLLWLLGRGTKEPPMLSSLVQVRRDLAFGWIDVETAIRQTDIILDGLHVADALQEELRPLMNIFEKSSAELRQAARKIEEAESALPGDLSQLSQEEQIRFAAMVKSARVHIREASKTLGELKTQFRKIKWRLTWYLVLSRETDEATRNLQLKIDRAQQDLSSSREELELKTSRLERRVGLDSG